MTPSEFEKRTARIISLLEGQAAKVQWNARVPDPDNPGQSRQIDILIECENLLTIVECRHRSNPQDVTWIEEIYGRKRNLRASAAIAVSSSRFTRGALLKSTALGIIVRDFGTLTSDEVTTWGKGTRAFLEYVQFDNPVEINIVTPVTMISSPLGYSDLFTQGNGQTWPIDVIFSEIAEKVSEIQQREGSIRCQMFSDDLYVAGVRIEELIVRANYRHLQVALLLPTVQVFGEPSSSVVDDNVYLERAGTSDFEVVRTDRGAYLIADLSVVEPMKNSIFRSIMFDMGESTTVRGVGLVGRVQPSANLIELKVRPIQRDDGWYSALLSEEGGPSPLIVLPQPRIRRIP